MNDLSALLFTAVPFAVAGVAVGALYFLLLYRTVRQCAEGGSGAVTLPLYLLRMAGAALFFWAVAGEGAMPLLFALAGFLAARAVAQHLVQRA